MFSSYEAELDVRATMASDFGAYLRQNRFAGARECRKKSLSIIRLDECVCDDRTWAEFRSKLGETEQHYIRD